MASRLREAKQISSNDLVIQNTNQGSTQDPSASNSGYQSLYYPSNGGYENVDNVEESCHEYEHLELKVSACQSDKGSAKDLQSSLEPRPQDTESKRKLSKTLCSGHIDFKTWWIPLSLGLIGITAILALLLTVLLLSGVIGLKCGCDTKQESTKQCKENIQPNVSTSFLLKKIDMLEKNMSSLVRQLMKSKYGGNECNNSNGGNDCNGEISGSGGNKENSSSLISITTEVKKLREKQVQLDSSYSLMKSKVHKLSQAEVDFRSSLEALKQKDAEVDTSLKRAKGVEAFLNTSVSQLKSVDGQIRNRVDQLNTRFMIKMSSINSTVNTMQVGGAGPPGPPGTPGAGNLSQCQHQQETFQGVSGSTSDFFVRFVVPRYSSVEDSDKIVVGATCSSVSGDETFLESKTNSQGQKVYLCTCRGQSNFVSGSGRMKCLIDVWVCPRIS